MEKECNKCFTIMPLTDEFWHRDSDKDDGFKGVCKMCRSEQVKKQKDRALDERVAKINERGFKFLEKITETGSDVPHIAETFQRLIEAFGGPDGLSQWYMAEFLSSAPGSGQRQRYLDTVMRMNIKTSELGAAQKSLDQLTEDEITHELDKRLLSCNRAIIHGKKTRNQRTDSSPKK
jgi:hypothetical protein|tara:strand:- start:6698 stop:7228 length:531 start_codon:yes stop_codon:yes gene_type:complete